MLPLEGGGGSYRFYTGPFQGPTPPPLTPLSKTKGWFQADSLSPFPLFMRDEGGGGAPRGEMREPRVFLARYWLIYWESVVCFTRNQGYKCFFFWIPRSFREMFYIGRGALVATQHLIPSAIPSRLRPPPRGPPLPLCSVPSAPTIFRSPPRSCRRRPGFRPLSRDSFGRKSFFSCKQKCHPIPNTRHPSPLRTRPWAHVIIFYFCVGFHISTAVPSPPPSPQRIPNPFFPSHSPPVR